MQEKRHDRVVEMRLCFFSGKVGDYKMLFVATRKCRSTARYFRENGISKLPSYKALQAEIETLIQEKNSGYNDYRAKREEYRRLQTVKGNIDQILHRERKPVKRQEQER